MEPMQQSNQHQEVPTAPEQSHNPALEAIPVQAEAMPAPNMLDLLKAGWQFVLLRTDIVGWYIALLAVTAVLSSDWLINMGGMTTFVAIIATFVAMIFIAMNSWGIMYAVSQPDPSLISYKQAFDWGAKHFFPLLWTTILVTLAVSIGFFLLIIPGIILTVYLYFSIYAVAMGYGSGVTALKQSYADVKGRWWPVAKKLLALALWVLLIYLAFAFVYGLFTTLGEVNEFTTMVFEALFSGVLGGVVGVMSMYALAQYYKYLRATR
jgi:hypothetical protein